MIQNLPLDPIDLDEFLVRIRDSIPFNEKFANPFFYLVKPTYENLSKYTLLVPKSYLFFALELLTFGLRILLNFVLSIGASIIHFWPRGAYGANLQDKKEFLFVSHFTQAQDPEKEDAYFGSLINLQQDFVFYLNHTRINAKKLLSKFEKQEKFNLVFNSKSLLPIQILLLQISQTRVSGWLFFQSLLMENLLIEERRIMLRAAVWQHSRATMANFTLKNRLTKSILKIEPKFLVLPLEGHAHEAMIINLRQSNFKDLRILGYQHAPLVPGQKNILRIVSSLGFNDYCLTSGEIPKLHILSIAPKCKVTVLGSRKHTNSKDYYKTLSQIQVLIAPEGTEESLLSFIELVNQLSLLLPNSYLILRPHPGLNTKITTNLLKNLKSNKNVSISTSSLSEDLKNSHFVLFRSSAVGIEGLSWGAQPIHLDPMRDNSLNPMALSDFPNISCADAKDISVLINNFDPKFFSSTEFQSSCYSYFNSYFGRLGDIKTLA